MFALAGLVPGGCRPKPQGTLEVVVIGGKPALRDPAMGPLAAGAAGQVHLMREVLAPDEEVARREEVLLAGRAAQAAVSGFAAAKVDLVLGGTFADLPYAQQSRLPRNSLRFDPAIGLFGL